ncbi:Bifunctional solanapyrone synthase [Daldinia childiae]|uniref:Bifunctional solanapyrone synthase n=1 Tax=Daldinia childiae TaxID=326645 RepID=UPI0014465484|nr:Bifunctional solanapyrone synthase [Daldinia childiae]KAF3059780.1 Bifunctional solanapyrone synthase [Daldinia childiae]
MGSQFQLHRAAVLHRAMSASLGEKVAFPGNQKYSSSISSYHSQQESHLEPLCIVIPTTSEDVSVAVRSLSSIAESLGDYEQSSCQFAIRSGGHTGNAGAANIAGGVTIDLHSLNTIEVSEDKSTVSVGVGTLWGDVYSALDPLGISVAGSRVAQVGVGGLTLGGGISYFSPRYGWTCDTVSNFEVVLANGSIVNANADENPGLLFALRGGSNNFGIVTRIDFQTFEQGPIWAGGVLSSSDTIDEQLKAFSDLNSAEYYDEYASLITNLGYAGGPKTFILTNIEYTKAEEHPPVFEPFMKISAIDEKVRISSMAEMAVEQGSYSKNGRRQLFVTITHKSTVPMLNAVYSKWDKSIETIKGVRGIVWAISLEPLPPAIYARSATSNIFGLSDRSDALVITLLTVFWRNEADDSKVEMAARKLFKEIEDDAKRLGAYDPFIYPNYAAPWQDPIASYGDESLRKLQRVRKDVDPKGVFSRQVPGGFKIPF